MGRPTYRELEEKYILTHNMTAIDLANWAMDQALDGMIPAANSIQIPPESEWPEWADCVKVVYPAYDNDHSEIVIKNIPRPKPQWVPKEGEAAFWLFESEVRVVKISQILFGSISIKTLTDSRYSTDLKYLKPFDATKIGLSWGKI